MARIVELILLFLALVHGASACTEIIYKDKCTGGSLISGRTLSFPVSLSPQIAWAKAGTKLRLLDIAPGKPSTMGKEITIKHNFVGTTNAASELRMVYKSDKDMQAKNWIWVTDGLNDKGLSAAVLYQIGTLKIPAYDPKSNKKNAINFQDLAAYALARFDNVPDLKKALTTNLQLTWNNVYDAWGKVLSAGKTNVHPLHLTFHDAKGRNLVVQIRNNVVEALDNPLGVFTNEPFLQGQYKHYNNWMKAMNSNPPNVYPSIKENPSGEEHDGSGGVFSGSTFWPFPGDYYGDSRFTRLAMAKTAADSVCYGNMSILLKGEAEPLSPGYVPQGYPKNNPTLLTVMGMLNTVYLPRGVSDHGLMGGKPVEFTPVSMLRDHINMVYYYRSANSPMYKAVKLRKVDWSAVNGIELALVNPPGMPWFLDTTNDFKKAGQPFAQEASPKKRANCSG